MTPAAVATGAHDGLVRARPDEDRAVAVSVVKTRTQRQRSQACVSDDEQCGGTFGSQQASICDGTTRSVMGGHDSPGLLAP
jgi:hypothetical protein